MQTETRATGPLPLVEEILTEEISQLAIDHPGAHDPEYRARRNFISRLARNFRESCRSGRIPPIPRVDYTEAETKVWRFVYDQLEEAHDRRGCSFYRHAKRK